MPKQEKNYYVYRHVFPDGKVYIGITNDPHRRWNNGIGYQRQGKVFSAIVKYGWDNIEHRIVASGLSLEEASAMEKKLICEYGCHAKEKTYNIEFVGWGANKNEVGEKKVNVDVPVLEMPWLVAVENQRFMRQFDDDWVGNHTDDGMYTNVIYAPDYVALYTTTGGNFESFRVIEQRFELPFGSLFNSNTTVAEVIKYLYGATPKERYVDPFTVAWLPYMS